MISFVNAKINIGLQIVRRRPDGYHDLQTLFYPIGLYAGTPENPEAFCDVLEIVRRDDAPEGDAIRLFLSGRSVACPVEKNLVYRAARIYYEKFSPDFGVDIRLDKHIPDGAGIGGGSADAAFTLRMLANLQGNGEDLSALALSLGADCPFFLYNRPCYAEGVGERLQEVSLELSGKWLLLVKPDIHISTREAFSGVTPHAADFDLRRLGELPISAWMHFVHNDFEDSIFPQHPEMARIKERLYDTGAEYASLTGSGSCLYGIYDTEQRASLARADIGSFPTIAATYLLKL